MCESDNNRLKREIKTNTVYQFRVQLSPAYSCHCVKIETVGYINLVSDRWCNASSNVLCARNESTTMTYLSQPVVTMMDASTGELKSLDCDHQFAKLNVTDIAIAHEEVFESCPKHQCLFPFMPLTSVNNKM